jgi:hypothetical protein
LAGWITELAEAEQRLPGYLGAPGEFSTTQAVSATRKGFVRYSLFSLSTERAYLGGLAGDVEVLGVFSEGKGLRRGRVCGIVGGVAGGG